ncbi:MAG: lysylphosphatidylglycerol synthase transmembrane domain-containing protein [Opitutaceae bacterium]|nr:lysylphosphatidylglycerol synthase transmembrane domain-containing protein [Opitutaceae bacterium]
MKRWLPFLVGLACSVAACVWIARTTELHDAIDAIGRLAPGSLVLVVASYSLGFLPRALRTVAMCGNAGSCSKRVAAEAVILGYAANNVLPLRLGEIVRTLFFAARTGMPATTSFALVAAERFLDALFLALVLSSALVGMSLRDPGLPAAYEILFLPALLLSVSGFAGAALLILFQPVLARRLAALQPSRFKDVATRALEATHFLRDRHRLLRVSLLSAGVWLCEGGMFAATAWALGFSQPVLAGYLALAVVNLGVLVPSSPGYVGVFHAAALFALVPLGVSKPEALAFGLVTHGVPFLLVTATGLVIFLRHHHLLLALRNRWAPSR